MKLTLEITEKELEWLKEKKPHRYLMIPIVWQDIEKHREEHSNEPMPLRIHLYE